MSDHPTPLQRVALTLRAEELVLDVQIGEKAVSVQLAPQSAMELASKLLEAGLEHARRRAELRVEANAIADEALRKAAH